MRTRSPLPTSLLVLFVAISSFPVAAQKHDPAPARFELVEATISEMLDAMNTGLLTSEQLVEMYLARIAAYDDAGPMLNSYLHVSESALIQARQLDVVRRRGGQTGPLYGIPVVLKDNVDTADMPTTAGSVALEGSIPAGDAFITRRLRRAGAIILGKLTMTEFANFLTNGMPGGYSSLGGYGFNPYDPRPLPDGDGRPGTLAVRVELRVGHCHRGKPGRGRHWHRNVRVDSRSGRRQWDRRHQAHGGPRQP